MTICCLCSKDMKDNNYHQLGSITSCIACYEEFTDNMKKICDGVGQTPGFIQGKTQLVTPNFDKKPFTTSVSENKIETVYFNQVTEICRFKVIGGWLVTSSFVGGSSAISSNIGGGFSTCFVPDPSHEWVVI